MIFKSICLKRSKSPDEFSCPVTTAIRFLHIFLVKATSRLLFKVTHCCRKIEKRKHFTLTLQCLLSTKRSYILKQTCSFQGTKGLIYYFGPFNKLYKKSFLTASFRKQVLRTTRLVPKKTIVKYSLSQKILTNANLTIVDAAKKNNK